MNTNETAGKRHTARFSCNEPNLQNIPVRTEEARSIRDAFVGEHVLVKSDFNWELLEVRFLTELRGDDR